MLLMNSSGEIPKAGKKHACDIHRVARQCGVKLYNGARTYRSSRGPGECFSPATLRRIGRRNGAGHLALVLRLIVESEGNAAELYAETLTAVSEIIRLNPELLDQGVSLYELFDAISLEELRTHAHSLSCGLPASQIMRVLLALQLAGLCNGDRSIMPKTVAMTAN